MGAFRIHLERVDGGAVTHVGVRELGKSYELAQVLGFPAFRRYSVAPSTKRPGALRSVHPRLPPEPLTAA